jgi:D-erythro-7,8-dihydroneopterin triphosphate epimerase
MAERAGDRIHIRDLKLRCIIGVYPEERREKQDVTIQITLVTDLRQAGQSDDLADTVDYKAVKQQVVAMVEGSSFQLVERLAQRIADICLAPPRVAAAQVVVEKPGALRFARTVAVEITRRKSEDQLA